MNVFSMLLFNYNSVYGIIIDYNILVI